jgi:hypothetical protein
MKSHSVAIREYSLIYLVSNNPNFSPACAGVPVGAGVLAIKDFLEDDDWIGDSGRACADDNMSLFTLTVSTRPFKEIIAAGVDWAHGPG